MTERPDVTETDGYKFSMAEAGAALREETFYYSHRHGGSNGWHLMPLDVEEFIRSHLPVASEGAFAFLNQHGYDVGAATRKAFTQLDRVKIRSIPKGTWFYNREPAFSVTGPSALVSWLEPLVLMLNFRIQVATRAKSVSHPQMSASCVQERDIIREVYDSVGEPCPSILVRSDEYEEAVKQRARKLVEIVKDPNRIFEVGMRAVSCMEQHEIALRAIKDAGILRTSNVHLARKLGMVPVGTMGHEHVQRYGDDYQAYIAMRDRFPGFLFYLPDTFDTIGSGVPSALRVIAEQPDRDAGIRFDSEHGIRGHYLYTATKAREYGLTPRLALESGWNAELTEEFEKLRETVGWPADRQAYGYGGHLVGVPWTGGFSRDDVSAVWKISQTGSVATMKFGDEPNSGKQSLPGRPIILRPLPMSSGPAIGYVAQEDEEWTPPTESRVLTGSTDPGRWLSTRTGKVVFSPETQRLIDLCTERRHKTIAQAAVSRLMFMRKG